jgi:hypothetical protein
MDRAQAAIREALNAPYGKVDPYAEVAESLPEEAMPCEITLTYSRGRLDPKQVLAMARSSNSVGMRPFCFFRNPH